MGRLLIVDDDQDTRALVAMALGQHGVAGTGGFDVVEAGTLADGFAAALGVNVLVVDAHLPDGSGLSLAEHLRGVSPDARIVVLSGAVDVAEAAKKIGADEFLLKPVSIGRLKSAVGSSTPAG